MSKLELSKAVYVRHLLDELSKITSQLKVLGFEVPSLEKNAEYENEIEELTKENAKLQEEIDILKVKKA